MWRMTSMAASQSWTLGVMTPFSVGGKHIKRRIGGLGGKGGWGGMGGLGGKGGAKKALAGLGVSRGRD